MDVPKNKTAVAVGLFDGLHIGHKRVIGTAVKISEENINISPAVFTFETHSVTTKGGSIKQILSDELKHEFLDDLCVEYLFSPDFNYIRDLSPIEFVEKVLCGKLNAAYVVCGVDFRFGKGASADASVLKAFCNALGIEVFVISDVTEKNGKRISSTMIRTLISDGEIDTVNSLLGYNYQIKMPVAHGKKLGRTIDFPTINQYFPEYQVIPKFGVYASVIEYNGLFFKGITNVGIKPTVQDSNTPLAETYIMGFDGDLYGKIVRLSLISFVRPEKKFADITELSLQIHEDIKAVEAILNNYTF